MHFAFISFRLLHDKNQANEKPHPEIEIERELTESQNENVAMNGKEMKCKMNGTIPMDDRLANEPLLISIHYLLCEIG